MTLKSILISATFILGITACSETKPADTAETEKPVQTQAASLNLYSARHYDNDEILYEKFTRETGIAINQISGNGDALIERIANEGADSPADVFLTADAGILWRADQRALFQPVNDAALNSAIPAPLRHPEGHWFGLTKRARIILFNKEQGLPEGLSRYEDLANPDYNNMICIRPSSNIYNQSLLASLIAHNGPENAQEWASGVVANFARKPQGNDSAQIEAVAAGLCRLAVVNSYYVARYTGALDGQKKEIGDAIGVLFPNQGTDENPGRGTHVNISGGGVLAHAPNRENAIKFLKFLASAENQSSFASGNNEYPVRADVEATGPIHDLGTFRQDQLPATKLGVHQREAVEIFDRAGWQ